MSARSLLCLCIITFPASFGLLQEGFFSSSDGMIHLYRLFELDRAVHAGILYPRWFPLSAYGYGLPVLNYYAPLAYYVAEVFHLLGAGYIAAVKLLIAFTFIVAAISMFLFSRDLIGNTPAFVASIAFVYLPYVLSDAYIRGNFPELLAIAFVPLVLFAFRRLGAARTPEFFVFAACSLAALVLVHQLTAMLAAPVIAAYIVFLSIITREMRGLLTSLGAVIVGLGLGAFYWVSALAELELVHVGAAAIPRFVASRLVPWDSFFTPNLAYAYLPQSEALRQTGGFPQTILALGIGLYVIGRVGTMVLTRSPDWYPRGAETIATRSAAWHGVMFFFVLLVSLFMVLDFSANIYYAIPVLRYLQFPWRFQILAGVSIAFLIGLGAYIVQGAFNGVQAKFILVCLSVGLVLLALLKLPVRPIDLTDDQLNLLRSADSQHVRAQMGWSWTREFVPIAVSVDSVVEPKSNARVAVAAGAVPSVRLEREGWLSRTLRVASAEPTEISLHTFFFPGWQAYIGGIATRTYAKDELGLVTVTVPTGDHTVEFRFEETPFRAAMNFVSVLTLVATAVWLFGARRRAVFATAAVIILLGSLFSMHARADAAIQPVAIDYRFDDQALLIGYSTERAHDALYVTLYWFALRETDQDYYSFVHLVQADGELIAQSDSSPNRGITPTTRWQKGELVADRHALVPSVPRGTNRLVVGMYLPRVDQIESLVAFDRAGNRIGNHVEIGRIALD